MEGCRKAEPGPLSSLQTGPTRSWFCWMRSFPTCQMFPVLHTEPISCCFCGWHLRCPFGQLTQPGRQSQHAEQRAVFLSPNPAFLEDLSLSLCFLQGLRGSAEGWEGEGNLVSEAHHLPGLFTCPLSSWNLTFFLPVLFIRERS